jgi:repeat uncharacterized protein DUF346
MKSIGRWDRARGMAVMLTALCVIAAAAPAPKPVIHRGAAALAAIPRVAEAVADGLTSDPTAVSWGSGRIDVFARGPDNALWHKWFDGNWSAWESLGGSLASGPDVASWGSGRLDVFARGMDNSLQHKSYAGQWSGWESLGGGLTSDPSAVSWGSGRLDVFARGGDMALWHIWYENAWSGWESLGGALGSGPDGAAWGKDRLDVFARGTDNTLVHKWYDGKWSGWESLGGGLTSDPSAVSWGLGRLDVFARGTDNALWWAYAKDNVWSKWQSLGGGLSSGPDVSSWGSGRLDVFALGGDRTLYHLAFNGAWSAWEGLGGPSLSTTTYTAPTSSKLSLATSGSLLTTTGSTLSTIEASPAPAAAGPAPTGISVTGAGISATIRWQLLYGTVSAKVTRWLQSNPSCCQASSPVQTEPNWGSWTDGGLQWPGTYVFRITVTYGDGKVGSADYLYTRPTPQDPTGFTAKQTGEGQVQLSWQPVTGVSTYLVGGAGAGVNGTQVNGTSVTLNSVSPGSQQWTVASLYSPGGLLTASANWPKASLTVSATTNRYRVVLEGFSALKATPEDALVADGLGDEVYIATQVSVFQPNGMLQTTSMITTSVFGDIRNFPNRIQAGRASLTGGLISLDNYPPTPPGGNAQVVSGLRFILWEGDLSDWGEWIGISPTIWEQDGNERIYRTFARYYQTTAASLKSNERLRVGRDAGNWEAAEDCGTDANGSPVVWVSPSGIGPVDVPISADQYHTWCPLWVTLSRKTFNSLLLPGTQLYQAAPGLYKTKLWSANGEYLLFIRVEKVR